MSNASNVGTSQHSLGEAIERLRGKWAAITAFGVLLVILGFAALFFSLVATIATVTPWPVLVLLLRPYALRSCCGVYPQRAQGTCLP